MNLVSLCLIPGLQSQERSGLSMFLRQEELTVVEIDQHLIPTR